MCHNGVVHGFVVQSRLFLLLSIDFFLSLGNDRLNMKGEKDCGLLMLISLVM